MVKKGELRNKSYAYNLELYFLPTTTAIKEGKLKHEKLCGDLYVAYELTGNTPYWHAPEDYDAFGLKPDRQMIYNGRIVFWEVDRGTEDYHTEKGIKGKLDRYIALSRSQPDKRFNVCFTTIDQYDLKGKLKRSAEARAEAILNLIATYNRADQFLVTTHKWAVKMPDLACFLSPKNLMGVSLDTAT